MSRTTELLQQRAFQPGNFPAIGPEPPRRPRHPWVMVIVALTIGFAIAKWILGP